MGIFGSWGKRSVSEDDAEATKQKAEDTKKEYDSRREAFLDSIRVDQSELNQSEGEKRQETSENNEEDDFDEMGNEIERGNEPTRDDDDEDVR